MQRGNWEVPLAIALSVLMGAVIWALIMIAVLGAV